MSKAMAVIEGFATSEQQFIEDAKDGMPLFKFTLAVPGTHENEETSFFNIRAWGKLALMCKGLISRSAYVRVDGSIKVRKYTKTEEDGSTRTYYNTGIVAHSVDLPYMK